MQTIAYEKSLPGYLLDITELKVRYLELSPSAFEAKNELFKKRVFPKDITEVLLKQICDNNEFKEGIGELHNG